MSGHLKLDCCNTQYFARKMKYCGTMMQDPERDAGRSSTDQQEIMGAIADIIIEIFAMESAILRVLKK
jgi:hypothetical protein